MNAIAQVCSTIAAPEFTAKLAQALPPKVSVDRFTRTALTALQVNPAVAGGDRSSLYNSIIRAAQDGLLPDGREGALVLFAGKVQWMPMMAGIVKRLHQSGITIEAQLVHENDEFEQLLGDDARIAHKAPKLGQPRGEIVGAYAIARTADGMVFREVMDRAQIDQVRRSSRSGGKGPWSDWYGEMARKTVLRRLAKRLPLSDGDFDVVSRDDALYDLAPTQAPTQPVEGVPASIAGLIAQEPEVDTGEAGAETAAAATVDADDDF